MIGYVLASSVLQLSATQWLSPERLVKKNILFRQIENEIEIERLCLLHTFVPKGFLAETGSGFSARNMLSNLGILLLELCFGGAIEEQDIWKSYLGPDGKPHQLPTIWPRATGLRWSLRKILLLSISSNAVYFAYLKRRQIGRTRNLYRHFTTVCWYHWKRSSISGLLRRLGLLE
jgi:hypothetical protein